MKTKFFLILLICSLFAVSCSSRICVTSQKDDEAQIDFSLNFSKKASELIKELVGVSVKNSSDELISSEEISSFLKSFGLQNINSTVKGSEKISASGTVPSVQKSSLSKVKILTKTQNSLTFSFGPTQIESLYNLADDISKSYFDLLMIPCLSGEELTPKQYKDLLASVYGPELASQIIDDKLVIELYSPNSKKVLKDSISLGELLTMQTQKTWSLKW